MDKPLLDAIGRILRDRFAEVQRAIAAVKVTRVEQTAPGTALLVFGDGTTHTLQLPGGERGAPGERGERGDAGIPLAPIRGDRGERGETGERGAPGPEGVGIAAVEQPEDDSSFTLRFTNGNSVDVELPRGPAGERGDAGEPGVDRFVCAPRSMRDGDRVEKNELVAWGGGILQCVRATTRTPDDEPASFVCIVSGVAAVQCVENIATRTYDITTRLTDGTEHTARMRAMPRLLGDGPRPGERIIRGDQFVKGDWLFTATADDVDPAVTDAGGWRRQFLRGKRGEDGARGPAGPAGVSVVDVELDGAVLVVKLSTGEHKLVNAAQLLEGVAA